MSKVYAFDVCGLRRACSSGFSRARQTAEIVRAHLGTPEVVIAEALRERCFGDWEGSATGNYARVWAADEVNPCYAGGNVETAAPRDRCGRLPPRADWGQWRGGS